MSLDPPKSDAELLRMLAERTGSGSLGGTVVVPRYPPVTNVVLAHEKVAPISLRIPWSALVSDNAMYVTKGDRRFVSPTYKLARKRLIALATDAMQGRPPADCPLAIVGRFWVPNNHRRDVHNFGATLADSLEGTVFTDDRLLHDVRWIRAGVDVDSPRAEILVTPL